MRYDTNVSKSNLSPLRIQGENIVLGAKLYGYAIYESLEYKISSRTLINIKNGKTTRFGETKARLFNYLLACSEKEFISDDEIFINVFEQNGLRCSRAYLWAMIRKLHFAFLSVGHEQAPLQRYEHKGYQVDFESVVEIYIALKTKRTTTRDEEDKY